jgi:hypothetical protein
MNNQQPVQTRKLKHHTRDRKLHYYRVKKRNSMHEKSWDVQIWNAVKEQRRNYKYVFIATALAMALTGKGDVFHGCKDSITFN